MALVPVPSYIFVGPRGSRSGATFHLRQDLPGDWSHDLYYTLCLLSGHGSRRHVYRPRNRFNYISLPCPSPVPTLSLPYDDGYGTDLVAGGTIVCDARKKDIDSNESGEWEGVPQ